MDYTKMTLDQLTAAAVRAAESNDKVVVAAILLEAKRRAEARGINAIKTKRHAELYAYARKVTGQT